MVASSSATVVGTVGTPFALFTSTSLSLACSASLSGSTDTANLAFDRVYSCAQNTSVSGGIAVIFWMELHIWSAVPSKSLPQPIANMVSPTNTFFSVGKWYTTWPAV